MRYIRAGQVRIDLRHRHQQRTHFQLSAPGEDVFRGAQLIALIQPLNRLLQILQRGGVSVRTKLRRGIELPVLFTGDIRAPVLPGSEQQIGVIGICVSLLLVQPVEETGRRSHHRRVICRIRLGRRHIQG